MMCLFLLLLVGLFLMYRRGRFGPPRPHGPETPQAQGWFGPWGPQPALRPEDEALKVLADRLASGDITPDEYMARVSVLRQQG